MGGGKYFGESSPQVIFGFNWKERNRNLFEDKEESVVWNL